MKLTNITGRNKNIDLYLAEIRKYESTFNQEEEQRLFQEIANGSEKAKTEIFNRTAKFALAIAKTYTGDANLLEDLIQEANMGVLDAMSKFNPTLGYHFISFAVYYIKLHISSYISSNNSTVSKKNPKLDSMCRKISDKFFQENYRYPSELELKKLLKVNGVIVKDTKSIYNITMSSLDMPIGDDPESERVSEEGELAEKISSNNEYMKTMESEYLLNILEGRLSRLSERERNIISMKYGLGYDFPMDYKDIAEKMSISTERVRQICQGAINKMK